MHRASDGACWAHASTLVLLSLLLLWLLCFFWFFFFLFFFYDDGADRGSSRNTGVPAGI